MRRIEGVRTLIVEDNKEVNKMLQAYLRRHRSSPNVTSVYDGFEALDLLRQDPYDLIITDYMMPGMNGLELIEFVRVLSPDSQIIVVSGLESEHLHDCLAQAKIDTFLQKPIQPKHLAQAIDDALNQVAQPTVKEDIPVATPPSGPAIPEVDRHLRDLNNEIGAYCCIITGDTGYRLASAGGQALPLDTLGILITGNVAASTEVSRLLDNEAPFGSAILEGPRYNIGWYVLPRKWTLIIVFNKLIKIGLVQHYARKAVTTLTNILPDQSPNYDKTDLTDLNLDTSIETSLDDLFSEDI